MKRAVAIALVGLLFFTACGSSDKKPEESSQKETVTETTAAQEKEENKEEAKEEKEAAPEKAKEAAVEEQVIFDEKGVRVTVTGLAADGMFGPELKMMVENEGAQNVTVQSRYSSINGIMTDGTMSIEVAAGKKANGSLTIMRSALKEAGIQDIGDVTFSLHIFDSDSWETIRDSEPIEVRTSLYGSFTQSVDDSGEVLFEKDGIRIVGQGWAEDSSWIGPGMKIFIVNDTGAAQTVQARDVSLDGFMVDPWFSTDVAAGKSAFSAVVFSKSDIESNGLEKPATMELKFHVLKADDWSTEINSDAIEVTF